MKGMKKILSAMLLAAIVFSAFGLNAFADSSDLFKLEMTAPEEVFAGDRIDVVISIADIKTDIYAIQFTLDFDETKLSPVITDPNEMNAFLTVCPQYTLSVGSVEALVPSYESMSKYVKNGGYYECMFADMLEYPMAKEGETYEPLKNDGDLVITISFDVLDTVKRGDELGFEIVEETVEGTEMLTVNGNSTIRTVGGAGSTVVSTVGPLIKNGVIVDDDGETRYYIDDVAQYQGVAQDKYGNIYYFNSQKVAVKNCKYGITAAKTNGIIEAGVYYFDADGKLVPEVKPNKNGIVFDEDGEIRYYVDGEPQYAGAVKATDGSIYYFNSTMKAVKNCKYGVTKANGVVEPGVYSFDANGKLVPEVKPNKNGIVFDEDGEIRYYVDGEPQYAGAVKAADGSIYYFNSTKKAVKNCKYGVTKANGVVEPGVYSFDANGKLIDETSKNGIIVDADGEIRYYINGVAQYAGVVRATDGSIYYFNSSKKAVRNCRYGITAAKTNGIIEAGVYNFDANGKLIVE